MIGFLLEWLQSEATELWTFLSSTFDPVRDTLDIFVVSLGIYSLLMLLKGTRAIQILLGLLALLALRLVSNLFDLVTLSWILENFLASAVLIIIVLFQADIRRVLARVGRGVFPRISERQESQILEEVVRAGQSLAKKRVGALIVLERDSGLEDLVEAGTPIDGVVSEELLTSIFLPYSPIHDGAVIVSEGRIRHAGCILPLTLSAKLPEGLGTRHRAAVGITEETDAVVIVVSEETGGISVVVGGNLTSNLDAPQLRVVLRDLFSRDSVLETPLEEILPSAGESGEDGRSSGPSNAVQTR